MTNNKFEVIIGMLFKFIIADMSFGKKTLMWKIYTTNKALLTTQQV